MKKLSCLLLAAFAVLASSKSFAQESSASFAPPTASDIPIALMIDLSSNQTLLSRDADRRFVPASITKVMTAFTAFEMMEAGRLLPNQRMMVTDETFEEWSGKGSSMFVPRGGSIRVDQLLMGITTVSANDGAVVLAQGATGSVDNWIEAMNRQARKLGMRDSRFGTPNGWPDEGYTFSTASDLAVLAKAILKRHPVRFRQYFGHRGMAFNGIAQDNHDPISGRVDGADGFKTGFTNQAGYGFLGTADRGGRRLVMVVAGAERSAIRDQAARDFLEWGFTAFENRRLFGAGQIVGHAQVQDGTQGEVELQTAGPVRVSVPRDRNAAVNVSIAYRGPVHAPIRQGAEIADLQIEVGGMPTARIPLVAAHTVEEATTLGRIGNAFRALLR